MKKLIPFAISGSVMFGAEACKYLIRNESLDSFSVAVSVNDPRTTVVQLISADPSNMLKPVDPQEIAGRTPEMCGKDAIRCTKLYEVTFEKEYAPPIGDEPFILFWNNKEKFKLTFPEETYAELRSDTFSEIHDDPGRREYDNLYAKYKSACHGDDVCDCNVRHWMVVGSYVIVYSYERECFPRRCVGIYHSSKDNSWISTIKEIDFDMWVGLFGIPSEYNSPIKQPWWSTCCCDCGDN
jgi:hypothetical protein